MTIYDSTAYYDRSAPKCDIAPANKPRTSNKGHCYSRLARLHIPSPGLPLAIPPFSLGRGAYLYLDENEP